MAYRVTIVKVRPNTDTAWYENSDAYDALIQESYLDTNKLSVTNSLSEDELTSTHVRDWVNEGTKDECSIHATSYANMKLRLAHNANVSITVAKTMLEV